MVMFMPDGIIPAFQKLVNRLSPQASSIRELTAEQLSEQDRAQTDEPADKPDGANPRETAETTELGR